MIDQDLGAGLTSFVFHISRTISSDVPATLTLTWQPVCFVKSDFQGLETYPAQATKFSSPSGAPTDWAMSVFRSPVELPPPPHPITAMAAIRPATHIQATFTG